MTAAVQNINAPTGKEVCELVKEALKEDITVAEACKKVSSSIGKPYQSVMKSYYNHRDPALRKKHNAKRRKNKKVTSTPVNKQEMLFVLGFIEKAGTASPDEMTKYIKSPRLNAVLGKLSKMGLVEKMEFEIPNLRPDKPSVNIKRWVTSDTFDLVKGILH